MIRIKSKTIFIILVILLIIGIILLCVTNSYVSMDANEFYNTYSDVQANAIWFWNGLGIFLITGCGMAILVWGIKFLIDNVEII